MSEATMSPAQKAAQKKTEKLAQWGEAANRRAEQKDAPAPSAKKMSYLYDLLRQDDVNDAFQKEVYTAMIYGGTKRQVDYFIDVLKGKATWSAKTAPAASTPAEQPEAAEATEAHEPAVVGASSDDFLNPFDDDKMPW